jgi:hypothetical protein
VPLDCELDIKYVARLTAVIWIIQRQTQGYDVINNDDVGLSTTFEYLCHINFFSIISYIESFNCINDKYNVMYKLVGEVEKHF